MEDYERKVVFITPETTGTVFEDAGKGARGGPPPPYLQIDSDVTNTTILLVFLLLVNGLSHQNCKG